MNNSKNLRLATLDDCTEILNIYAPFITDTVITFEYDVPTVEEFKDRMRNIQAKYPWLVYEVDGKIAGYAYASPFHVRAAYDWSVNFSIYIKPEYHGRHIGRTLYKALIEILKLQGYCNAYSLITMPNDKSEGIHKNFGFTTMGLCKDVGYKFGQWHDVKWYELQMQPHPEKPETPKLIEEIVDTYEFKKIMTGQ
ncbi:GNAT family N-acetyltransferase [Clostridium oryzae]|uniref:Phosphinothricin N-acetyltransferase n=1 Tax=Clostridium oryzae TaxID=1450648 RepID=A0A1V4IKF1_9CLOT|nr:GNAT family N-acetyltransferase [Clostridium oryzae]OPJ60304.1 phosphinothricin N-acetyltransferase [Clostridium oryzae]